jgi:hypothetical protein
MGCGCGGGDKKVAESNVRWKYRTRGGGAVTESPQSYATQYEATVAMARTGRTGETFSVKA